MRGKGKFVFAALSLLFVAALLGGCDKLVLLNPKGPIGHAERNMIYTALGLMAIVVIPVIVMALWFPRKYSASNKKATYAPGWDGSRKLELVIWLVPVAIIIVLGYLSWTKTHQLDPYKPIDPGVKPITVQVVSMDWKWLFIYPHYNIATVNKLVFPVDVPLSFFITSDTVVNSFFIPQLGSQMYAMAGMVSRLHLRADKPGVYSGQSEQFSGNGYASMFFKAHAVSRSEFEAWLKKVERSPDKLDAARFKELEKPSTANPVTYFSAVEPGLFNRIVRHFVPTSPGAITEAPGPIHVSKNASGGK